VVVKPKSYVDSSTMRSIQYCTLMTLLVYVINSLVDSRRRSDLEKPVARIY